MRRIRETTTIDRDSVSPDSISAAVDFLSKVILTRSEFWSVALDWGRTRVYTRRDKHEDFVVVMWVPVMK